MLKLIIFVIFLGSCQNWDLCGDWIPYKDIKCLKVLEQIGTEAEAVANCTQMDQKSTLISIHTKEEQEFLNNILGKYNKTSMYSWIGLKYSQFRSYDWIDRSHTDYTNWATDAVKDGTDPCVQMSLISSTLGKWTDVSCKKTGLFVCQKNQTFDLMTLKTAVESLQNESEVQKNEIKSLKSELEQKTGSIPIGFLYTQLPNQSSPQELFANTKWLDVSKDYAGLFFRAEGGSALPFGQIQPANQSWISDVQVWSIHYSEWKGANEIYNRSLQQGQWIDAFTGNYQATAKFKFYTTEGEIHPKNTAIRIWKRIQ